MNNYYNNNSNIYENAVGAGMHFIRSAVKLYKQPSWIHFKGAVEKLYTLTASSSSNAQSNSQHQTSTRNEADDIHDLDDSKDELSKPDDPDTVICQICLEQRRKIMFEPCCHVYACIQCCKSLQEHELEKCPICNQDIEHYKLFILS